MKSDHDGVVAGVEQSATGGIVSLQPITRRSMLRSVKEVRKSPPIFSHNSEDAELIALGETFQFLIQKEAIALERYNRAARRSRAAAERKSGMSHPPSDVWRAEELKIKNFDKISREIEDLSGEVGRLIDTIWTIQPRTLAGIKVYAEVARYWLEHLADDDFGARGPAHLINAILVTNKPPHQKNCQRKSLDAITA